MKYSSNTKAQTKGIIVAYQLQYINVANNACKCCKQLNKAQHEEKRELILNYVVSVITSHCTCVEMILPKNSLLHLQRILMNMKNYTGRVKTTDTFGRVLIAGII